MFIASKESSLNLQAIIVNCCSETANKLACKTILLIANLLTEKIGGFCLRKLAERDGLLRSSIEEYCLPRLSILVNNQSSSLVMKNLIDCSRTFREAFLLYTSINLRDITKTISSVNLVTAAIETTDDHRQFEALINDFLENPARWLRRRYLKRVLVSLIQKCQDSLLTKIEKAIGLQDNLYALLQDRYKVYIVLAFVKRDFRPMSTALRHVLKYHIHEMMASNLFKFLVDLLFRSKKDKLFSIVFDAVYRPGQTERQLIIMNKENCRIAYILAVCGRPEQFSMLTSIWMCFYKLPSSAFFRL